MEPAAAPLPPPIMIGPEGSYAWDVFHRRHVKLIANVIDALPYSGSQVAALRGLLSESIDGVMGRLPPGAPDARRWLEWDRGHYGKPWVHAPFLWAESYFFRRILEAVGYHGSADVDATAWVGVDPYAPMKDAELADPQLDTAFAWYDALEEADPARRFATLLEASVLGNRADLVFQVTEVVEDYALLSPPLADDTERILEHLTGGEPGRVAVVCDNAGRELLGDLLLVHDLLAEGWATSVDLHVKPDPYYISDTTAADVGKTLNRLRAMPGALGSAGRRLFEHAAEGRLRLRTHPFWCSPLSFHELPADLRADLSAARLVVFKGDLNYRRLVGDCLWDPTTLFDDAVDYLGDLPVAALRTLKSDVVVGVPRDRVERLDAEDPEWRINGRQTVVQFRG
ncbi:MAG TPA: damage-control phosphatase ARMT1 family protein [Actinocrinis sp.]|uniref:damage-control phosphatase ARMT1 family protein n=1 Tax=Actinocrinis sp. TaxID=1920516 RepID=UPI002DDCCC79|nr:damage-control phosphatase ARMT1 family protein [Actinocrinis sp.]HEV3171695.1 damage-control phosphatase ARMT1 family protein [Actinocrinis sp.]